MAQASGYHGLEWQRRNNPVLDLAAAVSKLRENESSSVPQAVVGSGVPVTRFDMIRLEATDPCQDNFTFETADVGGGALWQFWGVFDGHAGWQTSTVLRQSLVSYVVRELKELSPGVSDGAPASAVDTAIKKAFIRLDDDIVSGGLKAIENTSATRAEIIANATPAFHGSMAVLAIYDPASSTLRLASVGDSSAVLGQRRGELESSDTKWDVGPAAVSHSLSTNTAERERLIAEHPNEPGLITNDRVLRLPVSRAFGDHRWKWPAEAIDMGSAKFYGPEKLDKYVSPPYLHAEPDITTVTIRPGDFAVLASDGLWDSMTHEAAVDCLGRWVEETNRRTAAGEAPLDGTPGPECTDSVAIEGLEVSKSQIGEAWGWAVRPEDVVIEDGNAATHLVRNVLGGKRREQFTTIMSVLPPTTYDARDDVTVQVLFFGDVLKA
ncbi:protein serine/threonine phosphatase 2C [Thozetella sp. PMI_491]|nr:protein serine/threonine phosphatase 2C [Thozetella sp. PMI_491]